MANYVHYNVQYDQIIKDYGVTTQAEQELFKGKYDKDNNKRRFIYGLTLWADSDCEFIGSINRTNSSIKIKADQSVVLDNFVPWDSLKIKAPIGTVYDILIGM